jgi:hypothetical protein
MDGEDSWVKILQIVVIPIIVAVIALLWNTIQNWHRRHIFQKLIFRELEEISPYPEESSEWKNWYEYIKREFVHQKIFEKASENRDFILSLDPNLVYYLAQLWYTFRQDSEKKTNAGAPQWLHYLGKISRYAKDHNFDKKREIEKAYNNWREKINPYGE